MIASLEASHETAAGLTSEKDIFDQDLTVAGWGYTKVGWRHDPYTAELEGAGM